MIKASFVVALAMAVLSGPVFAQQGGGAVNSSGLPSGIDGPRTIPQQFASKLKLDKTQAPAVDELLSAGATEAAPLVQQMLQARQRMLNAARASNAEELKAAQDAYAASAAKVAGIEAVTFAKVYALLKPNQQKDAAQAFALIAGIFSNASGGGAARGRRWPWRCAMRFTRTPVIVVAVYIVVWSAGTVWAQGRGGGGGVGMPGGNFPFSRLESLVENFKLDGDKKKAVKAALDEAHKSAAPVRDGLLKTHAALGAVVQAGKSQEEIDAATRAYGEQAAAMAQIEMGAMAKVLSIADPELQNQPAIQAAFFMARGMFLKNSKWDEIPERNVPSY